MSHVSAVLKRSALRREFFDPKNKTHVESLKIFLSTGKWGSVQFECEPPFISVPEYVFRKYLCHKLGVQDIASFIPPAIDTLLETNSAISQIQTAS